MELPTGRPWLRLVGDGEDGCRLAKAFAHVDFPEDASGAIKMFGSHVIGTASRSLPTPIHRSSSGLRSILPRPATASRVLAEDSRVCDSRICVQAQFPP
jgi:hypothetical protein